MGANFAVLTLKFYRDTAIYMSKPSIQKNILTIVLTIPILTLTGCTQQKEKSIGIANPAAVYCIENKGKYEIREDKKGNQYGVCVFPDGSECNGWEYFRGECEPSQEAVEI